MAQITLTGKVLEIFPEQQITDKFKKREFIIETDDQYPQTLKLEIQNKNINLLDKIKVGMLVEALVNLKGTTWLNPRTNETSYFTTLVAWRLDEVKGMPDSKTAKTKYVPKEVHTYKPDYEGSGLDPLCDDLPF